MILAIDTSVKDSAVVAVQKGEIVLAKHKIESPRGHSQTLLPSIQKLLKDASCKPTDLTGITVKVGPGSYTGLRVGVAVAQALGYILNVPVNDHLIPKESIEIVYQ